jgi:hypothetical protein
VKFVSNRAGKNYYSQAMLTRFGPKAERHNLNVLSQSCFQQRQAAPPTAPATGINAC